MSNATPSLTSNPASNKKIGFWESQKLAKEKSYAKKAKKKTLKLDQLTIFTQQLAAMLDAGLPLVSALDAIREQIEDPVFTIIIREVRNEISAGSSFTDALRKFPNAFPRLLISMVEAGEASGALPEIMAKVSVYFEDSSKLFKKVKSALAYPVVVISLAVILVNVLLIFVIPVFAEMFKGFGAELPKPTQMLINISEFLQSNIIYMLIGGYLIYQGITRVAKTPRGRVIKDRVLNFLPLIGGLRMKIGVSRFSRTYAILLKSGVPILKSLEICSAASDNTYIESACSTMLRNVSQGGQLSETITNNDYFPNMVGHMIRAGEQTGNVEAMMVKVSDYYDVEINNTVAAMTSLLEPVMIVVLGTIIGAIVMAMFLPIFQLSSVVGS